MNSGTLNLKGWTKPSSAPALRPNREHWLEQLAEKLRPWIQTKAGLNVPKIQIGVGSLGKATSTLGLCYTKPDKNGRRQITISPLLEDPVEVAATLVHELLHAALPADAKHGPLFKDGMARVGLEGKATATVAGTDLRSHLVNIVGTMPPYPHVAPAVQAPKKRRAETVRVLNWKAMCPGRCGAIIRFGHKTYEKGPPVVTCGNAQCRNYGDPFDVMEDL